MERIPLFRCGLESETISDLGSVLLSGNLASGSSVNELELKISHRLNGRPVIATGDMTNALQIALKLAGVKSGDEVITQSFNCLSSTSAIAAIGARAVWADIEPDSAQMSIDSLESLINPSTKAIVVYHVAGYPGNLVEIKRAADYFKIPLIEDANNAMGATVNGSPIGTFGDYAIFSFYPNRHVNGIEGGALVCPNQSQALEGKKARRFGIDMKTFRTADGEINPDSDIVNAGLSSPLNNVNATVALRSLSMLDGRLALIRRNVNQILNALRDLPWLEPVARRMNSVPAYWVLLFRSRKRDQFQKMLRVEGIETSRVHCPNHFYSCFGSQSQHLRYTCDLFNEIFAVPCGWWLDRNDVDRIIGVMTKIALSL
jgi:dTDP-4-amino-4,6-dideoxygalactose transaminase